MNDSEKQNPMDFGNYTLKAASLISMPTLNGKTVSSSNNLVQVGAVGP
ncbi:MAG: hypothetical protein HYZ54_13935, partial [Ignavibacteriae bacterium]|nr:hypothetical protein [Ignavibacteriota bacterium]